MHYEWDFGFLWQYRGLIGIGVATTVGFTALTSLLGFAVGALIALARIAARPWMAAPLVALMEVFRCTPVLVQLVWIYYALPVLVGVELSPSAAAVVTLSLYGGAFYAEIIRGGIRVHRCGAVGCGPGARHDGASRC